jgi:hypothetical protein
MPQSQCGPRPAVDIGEFEPVEEAHAGRLPRNSVECVEPIVGVVRSYDRDQGWGVLDAPGARAAVTPARRHPKGSQACANDNHIAR